MIKAITCINRKPGMSVTDFQSYWRGNHSEVVKRLPNIRRYVQSHTLLSGYLKGDLAYDGIAEVWVEDVAALRDMARTEQYASVLADEKLFIDQSRMQLILAHEHVIKEEAIPSDGVKNIEFLTRKAGLEVGAFQTYWRDVHG